MHDSRLHEEIEDPYISQHHGNPEHTSALPDCDREFIKEPPYTLLHKKKLCTACLQQWPTNDSPAGYTSVCRSHPNSSTIFSNSNLVVMGGKFVAAIQTTTGECSYIISPHAKIISNEDGINWWTPSLWTCCTTQRVDVTPRVAWSENMNASGRR